MKRIFMEMKIVLLWYDECYFISENTRYVIWSLKLHDMSSDFWDNAICRLISETTQYAIWFPKLRDISFNLWNYMICDLISETTRYVIWSLKLNDKSFYFWNYTLLKYALYTLKTLVLCQIEVSAMNDGTCEICIIEDHMHTINSYIVKKELQNIFQQTSHIRSLVKVLTTFHTVSFPPLKVNSRFEGRVA